MSDTDSAAATGSSDESDTQNPNRTRAQISPRSLILQEAEALQMEAMARTRLAFRKLGLRKINEKSKYSNATRKSSAELSSAGSSKGGSSSGSKAGSFRTSRRSLRSQSSFKTVSGDSGFQSGTNSSTPSQSSNDLAGSFRSLLNDSFKQNFLYGQSFQLYELEQMLDEQFPLYRKDNPSASSDEGGSQRSRNVRTSVQQNFKQVSRRRMCWIQKILSSQSSLSRTQHTLDSNSNHTQSSTGRLLAGEVEWFNEDSSQNMDAGGNNMPQITVGGSFWQRRSWHDDPLLNNTCVSQSLSGFGNSDSPHGSPAPSVLTFSSSLKRMYDLFSFSKRNTPAGTARNTPQCTPRNSDSEARGAHKGLRRTDSSGQRTTHSHSPQRTNRIRRSMSASADELHAGEESPAFRERPQSDPQSAPVESIGGVHDLEPQSGREAADRSQDSTEERMSRDEAGPPPPLAETGREISEAFTSHTASTTAESDMLDSSLRMSREVSKTSTNYTFGGSGSSLTRTVDLAPRGSFVIKRNHHSSPQRDSKRGSSNEPTAPVSTETETGAGDEQHKRSGRRSRKRYVPTARLPL